MRKRFFTQLVVPLLLGAVVLLALHWQWPADGFFLNLSAGLIGSLVTVCYIDWILRKHEAQRWQVADSRINWQLSRLASATITRIRTSFNVDFDLMDPDHEVMRLEMLRIAADVLAPSAEERITQLDAKGWQQFAGQLAQSQSDCGMILDRFGHRLEPDTIALVLDLQKHLEGAQVFYITFPDVLGVSIDQVEGLNAASVALRENACTLTAIATRKVLDVSIQLSNSANPA